MFSEICHSRGRCAGDWLHPIGTTALVCLGEVTPLSLEIF